MHRQTKQRNGQTADIYNEMDQQRTNRQIQLMDRQNKQKRRAEHIDFYTTKTKEVRAER